MILSATDLFRDSWKLYKKNFWLFTGYAAWLLLPLAVFLILSNAPKHWAIAIIIILASLGELFIGIWILATVILTTIQLSENKQVDDVKTSKKALASMKNLLSTSVLQLLVILGGLILFIIPGLIFSIWYGFSQATAVLTGKRPVEALAHSKSLVKGRFFPVAWRMLSIPILLALGYSIIVGGLISTIASMLGQDPFTLVTGELPMWAEALETAGEIILIPLILIYQTLLYKHLNANPPTQTSSKKVSLENTENVT